MVNLGKMARDKVTGFEGVIIGRLNYLFGCAQYCLSPRAVKNELKNSEWFDEGRIEVIGEGVFPEDVQSDKPGGVNPICPKIR